MRSSASAPAKSEPPFVDRSPLQPMRSDESEGTGSTMAPAEAKASVPSK